MPHPLMNPTAFEIACVFYKALILAICKDKLGHFKFYYKNTGLNYGYNIKQEKFNSLLVQISSVFPGTVI